MTELVTIKFEDFNVGINNYKTVADFRRYFYFFKFLQKITKFYKKSLKKSKKSIDF